MSFPSMVSFFHLSQQSASLGETEGMDGVVRGGGREKKDKGIQEERERNRQSERAGRFDVRPLGLNSPGTSLWAFGDKH